MRVIKPCKERAKQEEFVSAEKKEPEGLIKCRIWTVCQKNEVAQDSIFMDGRFILSLKNYGTPNEKAKVKFVARRLDDRDKSFIVHDTSVLRLSSIRLVISSAGYIGFLIFSHEFRQAYLQSKERLMGKIFIRVKSEDKIIIGMKVDKIIHLNKPLTGLFDARDYFRLMISDHLADDLGIHHTI